VPLGHFRLSQAEVRRTPLLRLSEKGYEHCSDREFGRCTTPRSVSSAMLLPYPSAQPYKRCGFNKHTNGKSGFSYSQHRLIYVGKREPTSGLEPLTRSLRVIIQALQGFAQGCKSPISKSLSFLCFARCCTVLRSRWCQSGIKRGAKVLHDGARS
jgi:hypothetical protein